MEQEEIINQAKRIIGKTGDSVAIFPEALEFLRLYAGENSSFYKQLSGVSINKTELYVNSMINNTISAYISFLENGLATGISIERKAQIDVVSDFLDQARILLENNKMHPAAPCVLIGASLEEFLRNWVEEAGLSISTSNPTIDSLSKALRGEQLLTKQDMKDIGSWGGLRNHAAHGEWEEVDDRKKINLMLQGVNLFMRKYSNS